MLRGIGWGVLWMLSMALAPAVIGRAIDEGVAAGDTGALVRWSAVLLGLAIVQAVSTARRHRLAVFTWLGAAYRTVQVVTRQATRLGATLPRRIGAGEVVSVGVSDVSHIGDALDIVIRGTSAVVAIVAVTALMLAASPPLGLVVLAGVPLVLVAAAPLLRPYHRHNRRLRELVGDLNTRATDIVAGLRVLRGIGGEALFAERYRAESQRVRRAGVQVARSESMLAGAEALLPGLLIVAVIWLGARLAVSGTITPGELVTCYGYAVFLIHPMATLGEAADKLTKGHVAAGRVVGFLALEPELPDRGTTVPPSPAALADPASGLVVRPGLLTAVAAADPVDARAIADRLGRYADGEVTYGGVPLRDVADLRERIIVAVNEDVLLSGRLADTLTGGVPGRDLAGAVHAAAAEDIVDAVGLDAYVVEAGREFSGGQQQRLRLARAVAADPEVLVLVEPTSAVDAHTEARIAGRLGRARAGRTTVVCTTSPLVLDRADHVVFVEGGRVVAEGSHRELLDTEPRYAATVTRGQDRDRIPDGA
ncbi:ABC-type multidrug transport system, ATPase and permease component [Thermomonospora echinospora]|uniref:ABC-type multidrug transport system, ATPase and permease component n=1 Tax=Thermomonospora echinospora TaxID=1992 RepID=A0A1H6A2M8_9ACTN|nr:ABC-type multidrug transport system, ATPase and permease component [Thermomonospora echinospora]